MAQDDPSVEEIRAIRRKLWKRAGGTAEGVAKLIENDERIQAIIRRGRRGRGRGRDDSEQP